ncbi:MAG: choice-of-anchor L domain-containing protein [Brevirhabdus sp.]
MVQASELAIDTSATAEQMAEEIFGDGVEVVSATYTGDPVSSGIFTGADEVMAGVAPSDSGVILSTGKAQDVTNSSGEANQSAGKSTNTSGKDGDADLNDVAGFKTYDASILEAKFIPDGDVLTMQISFSSEEYLEYVGSGFNDAVGVWVNGEKAEMSVGDGEISINNINDKSNSDLYIDNANDQFNTEMDGFTVTITIKAPVKAGEENTIKIGIADAGDAAYDSNLMIAGDSVQTALVAMDDQVNVGVGGEKDVDLLANDVAPEGATLTITHINGQPIAVGQTVTLANGVELTLNDDGTVAVAGDDADSTVSFSYTVTDGDGNTDVGLVEVSTMPCFVAGTMIDTAHGPIAVDQIAPGDLVLTRDNGFQRVRWAGQQSCFADPRSGPIRIAPNTFGYHGALMVSPQHRLLVQGARASLLYGADEVLVSAAHLVDGDRVRRGRMGEQVSYVHLLFDRHEVIRSNGIWSESYLPGPQTLPGFDAAAQAEVLSIFPELDPQTGAGYGPAARLCLRRFEAQALMAEGA